MAQEDARVPGLLTAYLIIGGAIGGMLAFLAVVLAVVLVTKGVAGVGAMAAATIAFFSLLAVVMRLAVAWLVVRTRN